MQLSQAAEERVAGVDASNATLTNTLAGFQERIHTMLKKESAVEAGINRLRATTLSGGDFAQRVDGSMADAESRSASVLARAQ